MTALLDEEVVVFLTPSEWRVFTAFLKDGCDNSTLALRCGRSLDTVKTHMRVILGKAGCSTRSELAVAVLRNYIIMREEQINERRPS